MFSFSFFHGELSLRDGAELKAVKALTLTPPQKSHIGPNAPRSPLYLFSPQTKPTLPDVFFFFSFVRPDHSVLSSAPSVFCPRRMACSVQTCGGGMKNESIKARCFRKELERLGRYILKSDMVFVHSSVFHDGFV